MSCQRSHHLQKNCRPISALGLLENRLECVDHRLCEIGIDQIDELESENQEKNKVYNFLTKNDEIHLSISVFQKFSQFTKNHPTNPQKVIKSANLLIFSAKIRLFTCTNNSDLSFPLRISLRRHLPLRQTKIKFVFNFQFL